MPESAELRALTAAIDAIAPQVPLLQERLATEERGLALVQAEQSGVRQMLRRVVVAIVAGILISGMIFAAFLYSVSRQSVDNERAIESNNQRWCPVVEPLAPRVSDPPPVGSKEQVERALRIRAAFSKLVKDFGCTTAP
jgi:hypothetical protein